MKEANNSKNKYQEKRATASLSSSEMSP